MRLARSFLGESLTCGQCVSCTMWRDGLTVAWSPSGPPSCPPWHNRKIDDDRQALNYGMLIANRADGGDALVRLEKSGVNSGRPLHWAPHFCNAADALLLRGTHRGTWVSMRFAFRGRPCRIAALLVAALIFASVWGPFIGGRVIYWSASNEANRFLAEYRAGPPTRPCTTSCGSSMLLSAPFSDDRRLKRDVAACTSLPLALLLVVRICCGGPLVEIGTVGSSRPAIQPPTGHLVFVRYTCSPAGVYALIPAYRRHRATGVDPPS